VSRSVLRVVQLWGRTLLGEQRFGSHRHVRVSAARNADFTVPGELPAKFSLFRRDGKGWEIALGPGMNGVLRLKGVSMDAVSAFQHGILLEENFRTVRLAPGDWGHVVLSEAGHGFFFHVAGEERIVPGTYLRGLNVLWMSLLFALGFHGLVVALTWFLRSGHGGQLPRLGGYVVKLDAPPAPPPPEEKKPAAVDPRLGEEQAPVKVSSMMGNEGKSGTSPKNRPDKQMSGDRDPNKPQLSAASRKGTVLEHTDVLDDIIGGGPGDRLDKSIAGMVGPGNGGVAGPGTGTGSSTRGGTGPGGGGNNPNVVATNAPITTGPSRAPRGTADGTGLSEAQVSVSPGTPEGDFGGLTPEQVRRVVERNQRAIKYCFEKVLQRNMKLSGKVVLYWRIEPSGKVKPSPKVKSSTLGNADMEDCLTRQVGKWTFDAAPNGQITDVRYPFVFSAQ
jgi:hypothetical protein